jgi:hypothetical protein
MSGLEVAHGVGRVVQRVGRVDDRGEFVGFDEPGETLEVGVALLGDEPPFPAGATARRPGPDAAFMVVPPAGPVVEDRPAARRPASPGRFKTLFARYVCNRKLAIDL